MKLYFDRDDCMENRDRIVVDTKKIKEDKIDAMFTEEDIDWLREMDTSFGDKIAIHNQ